MSSFQSGFARLVGVLLLVHSASWSSFDELPSMESGIDEPAAFQKPMVEVLSLHAKPRAGDAGVLAVINPHAAGLGLRASWPRPEDALALAWEWHCDGATVVPGGSESYSLAVPSGAGLWAPGASYLFQLTVRQGEELVAQKQVTVLVNQAPAGGVLIADGPSNSVALTTPYALYAGHWSDPEGDLPLSYGFYADVAGPERPRLPLGEISTMDAVMTLLPSGERVTLGVRVVDSLGAFATTEAPSITVAPLPDDQHAALVEGFVTGEEPPGGATPAALYDMLLRVYELTNAEHHGSADDAARVLAALRFALLSTDGELSAEAVGVVASSLRRPLRDLASAAREDTYEHWRVAIEALANALSRASVMTHAMGQTILEALSDLLETDDCVVHRQAEQVLDQLAALAAVGLAEDSVPTTFSSRNIGLRVSRHFIDPSSVPLSPLSLPLPGPSIANIKFNTVTLPVKLLHELASELCHATLIIQAVYYRSGKLHTCAKEADGSRSVEMDGPYDDASSSSGVWSVKLLTACNATSPPSALRPGSIRTPMVLELSADTPNRRGVVTATARRQRNRQLLPVSESEEGPRPEPRHLLCDMGQAYEVKVTCHYGDASSAAANQTQSLSVLCDGTQASVSYECPLLSRCALFNETSHSWSAEHCMSVITPSTVATCRCAFPAGEGAWFSATAVQIQLTEALHAQLAVSGLMLPSHGVLLTLALLYATLCGALLIFRVRRKPEPPAYISQLPKTRMFWSVTRMLATETRRRRITLIGPPSSQSLLRDITLDDSNSTSGRSASSTTAQAKDVLDARLAKLQSALQLQDSWKGRRSSLSVLMSRLLSWSFQPNTKPRGGTEKGGARVLQATGETDEVKPPVVDKLAQTGRMTGSGRGARMEARLTGSAAVTEGSLGGSMGVQPSVPTDLDTLQHHFLVFADLLAMLALSLILTESGLNLALKLPSAAAVLQLHRGVVMPLATLLHAFILMAVVDPLHGVFKLLLHVVNRDERCASVVSQQLVSRDLAFTPPRSRELAGPCYVPLLRITITQLELVYATLAEQGPAGDAAWAATVMDAATEEQRPVVLALLAQYIRRLKLTLEEEYYRICDDEAVDDVTALRHAKSMHDRLQIRCDSWARPLRRLREFRVNPLEAIDRQAKMERALDQWVVKNLCNRPATDFVRRTYYSLFVGGLHEHNVGQSFFLPCYRRVLIYLLLMAYVAAVTAAILFLGRDITGPDAVTTLLSVATSVVLNEVAVWPLVALLQRAWGRRLLRSLHRDIQAHSDHFKAYFQYVNEMEDAFPPPSKPVSSRVASAAGSQRKGIIMDVKKGGRRLSGEVEKVHVQRGEEGPEPPTSFSQFSATIGSLQDRLGEMDAHYGGMVRGRQQASPLRPPPQKDMSMSSSLSSSGASSALALTDTQSSSTSSDGGPDKDKHRPQAGKRLSHSGTADRGAGGEELDGSGPLPFVAGDAGKAAATDNPLSRKRDGAAEVEGGGLGLGGAEKEKEGQRRVSVPASTSSSASSWSNLNLLPIRPLTSTGGSTSSSGSGSQGMGRLDSSLRRLGGLREQLGPLGNSGSSIDRSVAADGHRARQGATLGLGLRAPPPKEKEREKERERDHFVSLTGRLSDAMDRFSSAPVSSALSAATALRLVAGKLVPPVLRASSSGTQDKDKAASGKRRRAPLLMVDSSPTVVHQEGGGGRGGGKRGEGEESEGSGSSESEDEGQSGLSSPTLASTWVEAEVKGTQRELSKDRGKGRQAEKKAEKKAGRSEGAGAASVVGPLLMARLQPRHQGPLLMQGMSLTGSPSSMMMATGRGQATWRGTGEGSMGLGLGSGAEGSEDEGEGGAAAMYHTRTLRSNSGGALRRRKNSFSALSVAPEPPPELSPTAVAAGGSGAEGGGTSGKA